MTASYLRGSNLIGINRTHKQERGTAPNPHQGPASRVKPTAHAEAEMLTVGSRDSPCNFSTCWLGPSSPLFPSWGAAPPLIITLGCQDTGSTMRMAAAQNVTTAAAGVPCRKGQIILSVITVIHLQAGRQAGRERACSVLAPLLPLSGRLPPLLC